MAKKKFKRFVVESIGSSSISVTTYVLIDKKTGVNYLYASSGYGGGVTPLLDSNGKIVVSNTAEYALEIAEYEQ